MSCVLFLAEFCPDGEEASDDSDCEPCARGYYRNVTDMGEFSMCEICPEEFITNTTGATSQDDCNISTFSTWVIFNVLSNTFLY